MYGFPSVIASAFSSAAFSTPAFSAPTLPAPVTSFDATAWEFSYKQNDYCELGPAACTL